MFDPHSVAKKVQTPQKGYGALTICGEKEYNIDSRHSIQPNDFAVCKQDALETTGKDVGSYNNNLDSIYDKLNIKP